MPSTSFVFLHVIMAVAASTAASQTPQPFSFAGSSVLSELIAGLGLDETIWDAFAEAAVALTVFAVTSLLLKVYRKQASKNRPQKLATKKTIGVDNSRQSPASTKKVPRGSSEPWRSSAAREANSIVTDAPWRRSSPSTSPAGQQADAVANAVRAGNASQLPDILDAALSRSVAAAARHAQPISEENVASQLLLTALRSCASARLFRDAIVAYDHMVGRIGEGSAHLWSVLLYNVVEAEDFSRGEIVFKNLSRHTCPSGHDFANIVRCFAGKQDPPGLKNTLAELASMGHSVDTYSLNRALASCGASDCALDLADVIVTSPLCADGLDAVSYNTLMKCNARAGRLSRCFELREEMVAKGLHASEVTFGILLDACVNAQELDRARTVFEDMCHSGLQLNVVICTTLIKGLAGAGRLDEAASVLHEMKTSAGVKPDLIAYSTIVKAHADSGDVVAAMKMLEQMLAEGVRPDEIVFNGVLTGCTVFPIKSTFVMAHLERLIGHGLKPSTTTLSILLKALMLTDAWSTALQVLKDAPKRFGMRAEMRLYAQLAQACVKSRMGKAVAEVFDSMLAAAGEQGSRADPAAVGRILRSCLLGGDCALALELRDAAVQAGVPLDAQIEKLFSTTLARRGKVSKAATRASA